MSDSIYAWSRTPADNGAVDATINFAEFQTPSSLNDSNRAVMARVAALIADLSPNRTSTGTANAYAVTTFAAGATHRDGEMITFIPHATNTGACTLNVGGRGAKNWRPKSGTSFSADNIIAGVPVTAFYRQSTDEWLSPGTGYYVTTAASGVALQSITARLPQIGDLVVSLAPSPGPGRIRLTEATQSLLKADWPELNEWLSARSYPWGSTATHFSLPPAAGYYLRFAATSATVDTGGVRTAGSTQADQNKAATIPATGLTASTTISPNPHSHSSLYPQGGVPVGTAGPGGANQPATENRTTSNVTLTASTSISGSVTLAGGDEVRTKNVAFHLEVIASAALAAQQIAAFGFPYVWDTGTTAGDPGAGRIRGDNASLGSITQLFVSKTDALGVGIGATLAAFPLGTVINLSKVGAQANRLVVSATSTPTDNTTYFTIPVSVTTANGAMSGNVALEFALAGPSGVADVTAPAAFGFDNRLLRSDGTNKSIQASGVALSDANDMTGVNSISVGNAGLTVGTSIPFSDAAGTLTLQNVDAIDATTEATIEAAIDTLPNLTSIQGRTVTLNSNMTVSAFGASLVDDADAATARSTLGLVIGTNVAAHSAALAGTTASFTTAQETKLGHIAVTQAVDLDAIEARVNALDSAIILRGSWDASAGTFPGGGTAQAGDSWIVSVAGTVNSVAFVVGDRIIAILDNASTSTFASNWFKADYTDQVQSVFGRTGAVVATAGDYTATQITNTPAGTIAAVTVQAALNELDTEKLAAASYTASDVLAKLVTVDGAGSNVDADLLDGQQGAFYAPIASPTFTGTPAAPTPGSLADDSTRIPTTAWVQDVVGAAVLAAGSGDVVGPASAVNGDIATFSGTTGKLIAASSTIAIAKVSGLQTALDAKAPLASPAFTGTPTVPAATSVGTAAANTNYVHSAITNRLSGANDFLAGDEGAAFCWLTRTAVVNDYADLLSGSGRPENLLTVSRASTAMFVGRNRLMQTAAANALRYHHDPVTGDPLGALLEGASSNLVPFSEDLTDAGWSKANATISANVGGDQVGGATADVVIPTATASAVHSVKRSGDTVTAGATVTTSVYLQAAGYNFVLLRVGNSPESAAFQVEVNLAAGTVGVPSAYGAGATAIAARIEPALGTSYRVSLTGAVTGLTAYAVTAYVYNTAGSPSYSGDGTSGVAMWGFQQEVGAAATSYIPRLTGAAASRAADSVSAALSGLVAGVSEGTIIAEFSIGRAASSIAFAAEVSDGSYNERAGLFVDASNRNSGVIVDAGVNEASFSGATATAGALRRIAMSWRANSVTFVENGSVLATDTSATMPTLTTLTLGSQAGGGGHLNGVVRRAALITRGLTSAELQQRTAL